MGLDVDTVRRDYRVHDVAVAYGVALDRNGDEYEACCPFHAEETPSFTVFTGKDGTDRFHCFAGETRVITRNGVRAIRDLAGGVHTVLTRGGVWVDAPFRSFGVQPLMRLSLSRNGVTKDVYATSGHRWFVRAYRREVLTKDLRAGSRLECVLPPLSAERTSPSLAGIQHGYVFGDGTNWRKGTRGYIMGGNRSFMPAYFSGYTIRTYDDRMIVEGLPAGWKEFPETDDKEYLAGFLAGFIAADGHVAKDGTISLAQARREVLERVRDIATLLGIVTYPVTEQVRKGIDGRDSSLFRIHIAASTLPREMILNPELRDRLERSDKKFERHRWNVVSVSESGRVEEVYCAQVDVTHSFALEDFILTGNCFGCGERGDVIDFVMKIKGVNLPEAIRILSGGDAAMPNIAPRANTQARDLYAGIKLAATDEEIEVGKPLRLYNPKRAGHEWEWGKFTPSMVHRYASGMYVLRREMRDGGKETPMVCRVRLASGDECWSRFPFPKPRPLYGLDKLRDGQVILVEGEKCADAMRRATGRNVLSWAGGTQGAKHADWSPLAGRDVILWPDADEPGVTTMRAIGIHIKARANRVRILDVSGAPKGWDVADAIGEGWARERIDGFMRERIRPFDFQDHETTPEVPPERAPEPAAAPVPAKRERVPEHAPVGADGIMSLVGPFSDVAFGSEVFLANEFMMHATHAVGGKIVRADGKFWAYGPTSWREIRDDRLRLAVHGFDAIGVGIKGEPLKLGKRMIDGILHEFGTKVADPLFFDDPSVGVNVRNGTVFVGDDGAVTMSPHNPDDRFRFTIDADFDPSGDLLPPEGTLLHTLLKGAFLDDPDRVDKIGLVSEILGAAAFGLATRVKQPKAFVYLGETANNGKSTIMGLIECLLPKDAVSHLSPASFSDERKIVHLSGKAANTADELSAGAIAGEVFKAAVTGNPVEGRDLFKSAVTFKPLAVHCYTTNVLPRFHGGIDRGLRRRLVVVTFNRVIPDNEIIPDILDRIRNEELGALLRFAIAGAMRLKANGGYTIPPSSAVALNDWLLLDPINEWFEQRIIPAKSEPLEGWYRTSKLFQDFKEWAKDQGYTDRFLPEVNTFGQRLKALPNILVKRRAQGSVAVGVTLRSGWASGDDGPF